MSKILTRRTALIAGLATAGGLLLARTPRPLPPTYGNKDKDRARYAAIGESDRMTLKFVKP